MSQHRGPQPQLSNCSRITGDTLFTFFRYVSILECVSRETLREPKRGTPIFMAKETHKLTKVQTRTNTRSLCDVDTCGRKGQTGVGCAETDKQPRAYYLSCMRSRLAGGQPPLALPKWSPRMTSSSDGLISIFHNQQKLFRR
jgi:hypothetical protein